MAAFTNAEEEAVGLTKVMPFLLESKLINRGAKHTKADNFKQECSCKWAPGDWAKSCIGREYWRKNGGVIELVVMSGAQIYNNTEHLTLSAAAVAIASLSS